MDMNIDSLAKILTVSEDTHRITVLNLLARAYLYPVRTQNISEYSQLQAQAYIQEALHLSKKVNYSKGLGNAILNEGIFLLNKEKFKESLSSFHKAISLLKQQNDDYAVAICFENIAFVIHALGENKNATTYYDSAQSLFMKLGDTSAAVYNIAWKGHCYFDLGDYEYAFRLGSTALSLTKQTDTFLQTFNLAHLANLFLGAGLPEVTIQYLNKLLPFYPGIMDEKGTTTPWPLSWALERGGEAFLQLNNVDSAIKISRALNIPFEKMDVTNHLFYGHLYESLNQYQKALAHFSRGYLISKQGGRLIALSSHARELGNIYFKLNDFRKATQFAQEAFFVAQQINALLEMRNAAATLVSIYDQLGNFSKAYRYSKIYKALNDSLATEEYKRKLALFQVQNELQIQRQKAQLSNKESQLRQKELKRQELIRNVLIASFIVAIVFGIFIFRNSAASNRLKEKLKVIELRNTISRDLHDDVGSTLSSIRFLSSMALDDLKGTRYKHSNTLYSINESSQRMLDSMNDIIWSIQPHSDKIDNIFIRMVSFASELLEAQKIELKWNVSEDVKKAELGLNERHNVLMIFKEGVNNLAKYSSATQADIILELVGKNLVLTIRDNGTGFNPEVTNGNGLQNMKIRAQKIDAIYNIESSIGKGTTITLQIKPT